jgi:hypothetical protein
MVASNVTRWLRSETRLWIGNKQARTFLQQYRHVNEKGKSSKKEESRQRKRQAVKERRKSSKKEASRQRKRQVVKERGKSSKKEASRQRKRQAVKERGKPSKKEASRQRSRREGEWEREKLERNQGRFCRAGGLPYSCTW